MGNHMPNAPSMRALSCRHTDATRPTRVGEYDLYSMNVVANTSPSNSPTSLQNSSPVSSLGSPRATSESLNNLVLPRSYEEIMRDMHLGETLPHTHTSDSQSWHQGRVTWDYLHTTARNLPEFYDVDALWTVIHFAGACWECSRCSMSWLGLMELLKCHRANLVGNGADAECFLVDLHNVWRTNFSKKAFTWENYMHKYKSTTTYRAVLNRAFSTEFQVRHLSVDDTIVMAPSTEDLSSLDDAPIPLNIYPWEPPTASAE